MPGNPGRPVYGAHEPEPLPQRAFEPIKRAVLNGIARNAAHPIVGLVVIDYLTEHIGVPSRATSSARPYSARVS